MIRSEYDHLIRTKSSGQIFTPSHSSALMGTAGARAGGGDLEGPPKDLHRLRHQHPGIPLLLHLRCPPSRHRSSQESQPLTDLVISLVGVLIISRAWTDQHLQQPVNVLKYIMTFVLCKMLTHQYSNSPFML